MEYKARQHQLQVLKSDKKFTFMGGGIASGKKDVGSLWSLLKIEETPKGALGCILANSYGQLKDSTLRNLYKNFKSWNMPFRPKELPTGYGPFNIKCWNGESWIEILCRSLDNYEILSGIELGWVWIDEAWGSTKDAFDLVVGRVRDKRMENKLLLTSILDDPGVSWIYEFFVSNYDPGLMKVVYADTYQNEVNLPPTFIPDLKKTYSDKEFQRLVLAKWVSLEGSIIYNSFDRKLHITEEASFSEWLPILWSFDFNIGMGKPMSSVICHIKKGEDIMGYKRPELHVFDEIVIPGTDTNDIIKEFEARPWLEKARAPKDYITRIYGDASGQARDTRSKLTDYAILRDAGYGDQKVPNANPPIRDRHNAVNALLKNADGDVRLKIHPRCKVLARGLETVHLKKGAGYLEEETYSQHITTALGYLVNKEFPIQKYQGKMVNVQGF